MDAKPARQRKDVNPAARNKAAESIFKDDGADDKSAGIEQCRKRIDLSSNVPGASALCFVFCVRHGHCYGFHVVPLEGRRDAFLPIFSHMKTAPKIVYYDFACGLDEYFYNREPQFWENTRPFVDIFHGFGHKCSRSFKADRINLFRDHNSSICEQFNSFIRRVKHCSANMSLPHLMFLVMLLVALWNRDHAPKILKALEEVSTYARAPTTIPVTSELGFI